MADNFSPGTVISARDRLWRVHQQDGEVLTATPIDSGGDGQQRFYLPMEEEINRGKLEWPSRETIGTPQAQDLLLRAHRLSMLHGTAPLLSLQRSRVIPKNFQLVPVVMALEMRKRVRMLIADDVGLGKTIEAGLIITELMARQLASRILVVVPASLREQWREALNYFFHPPAYHLDAPPPRDAALSTAPCGCSPIRRTNQDPPPPAHRKQLFKPMVLLCRSALLPIVAWLTDNPAAVDLRLPRGAHWSHRGRLIQLATEAVLNNIEHIRSC